MAGKSRQMFSKLFWQAIKQTVLKITTNAWQYCQKITRKLCQMYCTFPSLSLWILQLLTLLEGHFWRCDVLNYGCKLEWKANGSIHVALLNKYKEYTDMIDFMGGWKQIYCRKRPTKAILWTIYAIRFYEIISLF